MKNFFSSKLLSISLGLFMAGTFVVPTAFGVDIGLGIVNDAADKAGFEAATETSFAESVGKFVQAGLSLLGIIFTILVIYAGMRWMLARGNESEVEEAQKILRNAVIGLLLSISAYAFTNYIIRIFGA